MNDDKGSAQQRPRRVTRVGPKTKPDDRGAPAEAAAAPPAPRSPADNISRRLQWGFMVAILAGSAFAFVGVLPGPLRWVGFGGPLLAIAAYFTWGQRSGFSLRADTRQRFADSCYFLGFLLTMIAMLVGFFPAGMFGWALRSTDILRHFSMALGATALGLIFRIIALQGGRSVEEDVGEAEAELRAYVGKVSTEAREIGAELENIRTHLAAHHASLQDQLSKAIPAAIEETLALVRRTAADISRGLEKQASSLQSTAQSVAAGLETRFGELGRIERETANDEAALKQSITEMAGAVSALSSTVRDMQGRTRDAIEGATAEIARMGAAFGQAGQMTASLSAGMAAIEARVGSVGEGIGRVDQNVASAKAASAGLVEKVEDIGAQLRADQDGARAALRTEVAAAGQRVAQVAGEAVERFRQETEQSLGRVDANIASATSASAGLAEKAGDLGAQLRADQDGAQAAIRAEIAAAGGRIAQAAEEAVDRLRQDAEHSVAGTLREGRQQSEAISRRAAELETSLDSAIVRFTEVVDRFSKELARLRAEGDQG